MKKTFIVLSLLSTVMGVVVQAAEIQALTQSTNTNDENNDNRDDVTAGDATNKATFSWSGSTLTVTGKGDLSKITVTDDNTKVFSAAGAGKVYTKSGETSTAVKQGDAYDSETKYYEPTITYGEAMTPSTEWNGNYSMSSAFTLTLGENQTMHSIYWGDNGSIAYVGATAKTASEVQSNNNWNNLDNTTKYYYWCVFEGTCSETKDFTLSMSAFTNGVYQGEGYKIILLNTSNRDNYGRTVSTIKASVDNLYYSTDATNYNYLAKETTVEYTEGMKLYLGTVTVKDDAIEDNATYFGETHADYLTGAVLSFAEYLPHAVGTTYSTVVFKTEKDETEKALVNNAITCALVKIPAITTLNLQDTRIQSINANVSGDNTCDPTFFLLTPGAWPNQNNTGDVNTTLTTLYTPQVINGETLKQGAFFCLSSLKTLYLGEGIKTLDKNCFDATQANYTKFQLSNIVFPNTLETIEKDAFAGQYGIMAFTFPATLKVIKSGAFSSANPKDVYFLGLDAPKVEKDAWGDNSYISNNSLKISTVTYDNNQGEVGGVKVDLETGVATRLTYLTQNGYMTMLHYPSKCSKMQAAKYTDLTRTYKKIVYGNPSQDSDIKVKKQEEDVTGSVTYYYYAPGKETTAITGTTNSTTGAAGGTEANPFTNMYPAGTYGGNYAGGYDDVFVGSQYNWPSMVMAYRATVVAQHGLLWDGVTTIKQGINNAKAEGEEEYTGTGEEFIGLHQFVFAQGDVTTDNTNEWDVTKYADGKWHSLCLPFDITKAKLEETFGPDAEGKYTYRVCKFNQVDRNEKNLKLYFNNEQYQGKGLNADDVVIEGHVSYMVKLKKENIAEGEKVLLKNYVMKEGSAVPTNVKVNEATESDDTKAANQYYFIGQYLSDVKIPQYSYFFSKTTGGFRFQGGTTGKWNAYSSVVEAPNGAEDNERYFSDGNSDSKLSTIWDNDDVTAIDRVTIEAGGEIVYTNANVYNLNGQLVSTNGLQGLQKGIYVTNGKKVIVR